MKRADFIKQLLAGGLLLMTNPLKALQSRFLELPETDHTMPVLFVGHGSPALALRDNPFGQAWARTAAQLPAPRAVLCISAHWLTRGTYVTAVEQPRTIHDFGGFAKELFEVQYPAPGHPDLAKAITEQVHYTQVHEDHEWGLDHGTWTVLMKMYPEAHIPVLQMSIDYLQPPAFHYELAKDLAFLRKRGVLIVASGNIVHNLRRADFANEQSSYDWASVFDAQAKQFMDKGNHKALIKYTSLGREAQLSIPTPDHYYPLLYTLGLQSTRDQLSYPVDGMTHGSISMRSVLLTEG